MERQIGPYRIDSLMCSFPDLLLEYLSFYRKSKGTGSLRRTCMVVMGRF